MKIPSLLRLPARLGLIQLAFLFTLHSSHAGSATWNLNPTSGNWNTAANWTPATVPNGATDTATFSSSSLTAISFSKSNTVVDSILFDANASAFSITANRTRTLKVTGAGVVNESSAEQEFVTLADSSGFGTISFEGNATAGTIALYQ